MEPVYSLPLSATTLLDDKVFGQSKGRMETSPPNPCACYLFVFFCFFSDEVGFL